jgi:hypothetical protein
MRKIKGMLEEKRVCIMCDFSPDPVWASAGFNESLDDLPVTDDLKQRLSAWADRYCDFVAFEDYGAELDLKEFSRTGLELAREVKAQLPDWTIEYFDEEAAATVLPTGRRETFIYEIEL